MTLPPLLSAPFQIDLAAKLNKTQVVSVTMPLSQQAGYYCSVCDCQLRDSQSYLDHINGGWTSGVGWAGGAGQGEMGARVAVRSFSHTWTSSTVGAVGAQGRAGQVGVGAGAQSDEVRATICPCP